MLYYFFTWLNKHYDVSGARLFEYNSFRTAMAVLFSLLIATVYGRRVINLLRKNQIGETVRDLGLQGEQQKMQQYFEGFECVSTPVDSNFRVLRVVGHDVEFVNAANNDKQGLWTSARFIEQ